MKASSSKFSFFFPQTNRPIVNTNSDGVVSDREECGETNRFRHPVRLRARLRIQIKSNRVTECTSKKKLYFIFSSGKSCPGDGRAWDRVGNSIIIIMIITCTARIVWCVSSRARPNAVFLSRLFEVGTGIFFLNFFFFDDSTSSYRKHDGKKMCNIPFRPLLLFRIPSITS